jgi:hypothetical protein
MKVHEAKAPQQNFITQNSVPKKHKERKKAKDKYIQIEEGH